MSKEVEEWRDVVGYESLLQVSNLGRIRSKDRVISFSDNKPPRKYQGKILIANIDRLGYPRLRFNINGKKVSIRVHRMVASAFIPNPNNKPQVNHKNGEKSDNSVHNLEWVTNGENQCHANSTGLRTVRTGQTSPRFKGPVEVYNSEGVHINTLYGNKDMESKGFDFRLVSACLKGKRSHHAGCTFKKITDV